MSDYNFLMESKLSQEQYSVLSLISRSAYEQGLNLYLVGGAVRDLTYGQQVVRDLDFALQGDPLKVLRRLGTEDSSPMTGFTSRPVMANGEPLALEYQEFDPQIAAAELWFTNGVRVELGQCREDVFSKPGQRPEMRPATIFEDLKRRDFSVNAMAISLHPNSRGLLLDPTNGAADIERRELRVLHPRSFSEDPLRIYRLLRLGLRLDFTPEERTKNYFETALQNHAWERLGVDQQGDELRATLQEENPARILKVLVERKLLGGLDKKLASVRITYEHFSKTRAAAQIVPGTVSYLVNFLCLVEKLSDSKADLPHQVYTLLTKESRHLLLFLLVYYPQAKVQSRVKNFLTKYLPLRAKLPQAELEALGFKPGAKFDQIIESVFLDQLDGKIKTPQQLTTALRERAGIKEPPAAPATRAHPPRKSKEVAKRKQVGPEAKAPSPHPLGSLSPAQSPPGAMDKGKLPGKSPRAGRPKN
jgi:tRNA nucleotidyltransferase/poly(A) polymerase